MANTGQSNEEAQKFTALFTQIRKTLPIINYRYMIDESVKPLLNTFGGYEHNHQSPSFSINLAKDCKASLTSVTATI